MLLKLKLGVLEEEVGLLWERVPWSCIKFVVNHFRAQSPVLKVTGVWERMASLFPRRDQRQDAEFGGSLV